jgi:hypothetical protein
MARWRQHLLIGTIVWIVGYLAAYLIIMSQQQDSSPAWWYIALMVVVAAMLALVAAGQLGRPSLVTATGLLGFATLIAMLSIGVFLLPALIAAVMAASMPGAPSRRRSVIH